jgi:hypothetical protein
MRDIGPDFVRSYPSHSSCALDLGEAEMSSSIVFLNQAEYLVRIVRPFNGAPESLAFPVLLRIVGARQIGRIQRFI